MYPTDEIKKEIDRGMGLGPDRYDSVVFRDDGSVLAQLCRRTIVQGRTVDIEYDIHNSNLTGVYDEEDTVVRLRAEKN